MIVQLIEGVEELFLRALLARDAMNVVDQQDVGGAVMPVKKRHAVELDRRDHLIHETLAGSVDDVQAVEILEQAVADGVYEVRLADAHPAIDEQRIVAARRHLGYRQRRSVGQLIRRAYDITVEREPRVQPGCRAFECGLAGMRPPATRALISRIAIACGRCACQRFDFVAHAPNRKVQLLNRSPDVRCVFLADPRLRCLIRNPYG